GFELVGPLAQTTQDYIWSQLVVLDDELWDKDIGNPGGRLLPGMFIPEPVIAVIIDNFTEITSPHELSDLLQPFALHPKWLEAIWSSLTQKILPEIRQQHEKRRKERAEEETRVMLRELKDDEAVELAKLSPTLTPFTSEKDPNLTSKTIATLARELRWHRLWNPQFPKPKTAMRKRDYLEPLNEAFRQFNNSGRTVEEVRRILDQRRELILDNTR
ncbi:hypothetical protein PQX77_002522, partial [Marasmius sp. AFHP31]